MKVTGINLKKNVENTYYTFIKTIFKFIVLHGESLSFFYAPTSAVFCFPQRHLLAAPLWSWE